MSTTHIAPTDGAIAASGSPTTMSDCVAPTTQLATTIPKIAGNLSDHKDPPCYPAGCSPIERMPNEILTQICDLVVPNFKAKQTLIDAKFPSFRDTGIRALALTSKRLQPLAQRAMYNFIVLGGKRKSIWLLRSLLRFPRNRKLVQLLEVRPPVEVSIYDAPKKPPLADISNDLYTIYSDERYNPQLPPELLSDIEREFDPFASPQTGWIHWCAEYPRGDFNTVTRAIIHLCPNIQSFKVQVMGEWSGATCYHTLTDPRFLLAWPQQPAIAFNHLRTLDLDAASIADFANRHTSSNMRNREMFKRDISCPPTVEDLTLRYEDAGLSLNFLPTYFFDSGRDRDHSLPCLDDLFHFLMPCSASLSKLRLLGGFDHAGLLVPTCVFTHQKVCDNNWNTILPHFQQLVHLEFDGYGNPYPPDDRNRNTWPDNVYRYGTDRTITCLSQLPKLRYLKLPLVDLLPLSPGAFPNTVQGLRELVTEESQRDRNLGSPLGRPGWSHNSGRGTRKAMIQCMDTLAGTLDTGKGSRYNVGEKLRQAAGGGEIPSNLEKVELYYFVEDTDKEKDPRERWVKSGKFSFLGRREIEMHEAHLAQKTGWFPTEEKMITWTKGHCYTF